MDILKRLHIAENNGYRVAEFLEKKLHEDPNYINKDVVIIIHTMNTVASVRMYQALKKYDTNLISFDNLDKETFQNIIFNHENATRK